MMDLKTTFNFAQLEFGVTIRMQMLMNQAHFPQRIFIYENTKGHLWDFLTY